ncbi:MAG: hypothetical protein M3O31_14215 [Acidobacteriota bacterium]|nr:hypothetical protein [Acidobacteriota bacterium]
MGVSGRGSGCVDPPCAGLALGDKLDAGLAVAALRQAIDLRQPAQYASNVYVNLLLGHGIQPSA